MVESSKILTVSYGTFSCTLEGFDDSFGTMKAIAEYFRDLAADDRYFGAEPPAPDVAMLAKIAEREITRRVDARTEDGGIVLRASQALAPVMPPQVTAPDPLQAAAASVTPQVAPAAQDHIHDDFQTAQSDAVADDLEPAAAPLDAMDSTPKDGLTFDDMAQDVVAEAPAHPDAESVAAKLQRIRAVVGKAPVKAQDADFAEDLADVPTPDVVDVPDTMLDETVEFEAPAQTTDVKTADIDMSDLDFDTQDSIVEVEAPQQDITEVEEDIAEIAETATETVAPAMDDDDAMLNGLAAKVAQTAEKSAIRAQILRIRKPETPKVAVEEPLVEADSFDFVETDLTEDTSDYDDADYDLDEDLPNVAALDGAEDLEGFDTPTNTSLSEDDEADLMEELAEVERDYAPVQQKPAVQDEVAIEAPKPRTTLPATDDATMSHLLKETDQQLNEPEGSRRRDAIAQLKAAVAATEAARQLGDKGRDKDETEDAFRDDLKDVVRPTRTTPARPTRVQPSDARTERPRPAPLKLVASQRVDAVAPAPDSKPVQPRRVATIAEPVNPAAASSFAEFAEEMGATALPDLLEAAAAYTSFVEGVEDFSRPQIMKKVQSSTETEFSREDGLRSFGTLLRQGRISKVRNGRFQVSDASRFKPETKAG